MAHLFRSAVASWAARPDPQAWLRLAAARLAAPNHSFHPSIWRFPGSVWRRLWPQAPQPATAAAMWAALGARGRDLAVPAGYGLTQGPIWQLVMVLTRAELFTLGLWCGACMVHRQVCGAVARQEAQRWRRRLGPALYADVLRAHALGVCKPAPPVHALQTGRLTLEIGLAALAAWGADPQGWVARRISASAGAGHGVLTELLDLRCLAPLPPPQVQAPLLAFVARHGHVE